MADEKLDAPQTSQPEEQFPVQSSRKDLWLFLIIIDVVLLCVFGFFLYKNLSAKLLAPQTPAAPVETVVEPPEEEVLSETVAVLDVEAEPVTVAPVVEKTVVEKPVEAAPVKPAQPVQQETLSPKKQSVIVQVNPKSKYRQVTFRYFGDAKEVAVVSGFTMAKPRALKKVNGVWETTLAISPGSYRYLLVVDGKQMPDPYAEQQDGRSLLTVE